MSDQWLCQRVDEQDERLTRVELMLDRVGIRLGANASFHGSTWEISEQQIAQWVAGTDLPLSAQSSYVRFIDGSLEIRGGMFSIHSRESGAHMEMDAESFIVYDDAGNPTVNFNFLTGDALFEGKLVANEGELHTLSVEDLLTMSAGGEIRLGDGGGVDVDFNGIRIYKTADPQYRIEGQKAGDVQFYVDNTGQLRSGNATNYVMIKEDGLWVYSTGAATYNFKFFNSGTDGTYANEVGFGNMQADDPDGNFYGCMDFGLWLDANNQTVSQHWKGGWRVVIQEGGDWGFPLEAALHQVSIDGNLIIGPAGFNRYLNFGTTVGAGGYGFRDNAGTLEWKNSAGVWDVFGGGEGMVAHDLGGAYHNEDTLANLNTKVSDATLDKVGDTRPPAAHDLDAHGSATLAELNAKVSDATLDKNTDTRPPAAHDLDAHGSATLDELNAKVSDATLDDDGESRPPLTHKASHQDNGADEINVGGLSGVLADQQHASLHGLGSAAHGSATLAELNAKVSDATLDKNTDTRTPKSHKASHQDGGSDEIDVTGLKGTFHPYLSRGTGWFPNTIDYVNNTKLDTSAVFGVPANIKAISLHMAVTDSAAGGGNNYYFFIGPASGDWLGFGCYPHHSGLSVTAAGVMGCDGTGDIWYQSRASGTDNMTVYLVCLGYWT